MGTTFSFNTNCAIENALHCLEAAPVWKEGWERGGTDDITVSAAAILA